MPKLESKLNTRNSEFIANKQLMQSVVDDLVLKIRQIELGGGESARKKHIDRLWTISRN